VLGVFGIMLISGCWMGWDGVYNEMCTPDGGFFFTHSIISHSHSHQFLPALLFIIFSFLYLPYHIA